MGATHIARSTDIFTSFTSEMTYGVESLPCIRHPIPHRDEESLSFLTPCTILGFALFLYAGFDFILSKGSRIKMVSFLILLLPTLGLMGNHKGELASDRYIYPAFILCRSLDSHRFVSSACQDSICPNDLVCSCCVLCCRVILTRSNLRFSLELLSRFVATHCNSVRTERCEINECICA